MTSSLQGAGRELDQRIATEVMGWIGVVPEHVEAGGTRWFVPSGKPSLPEKRVQVPEYSTDIRAAFEVVEKMREKMRENGWRYCLIGYVSSPDQECVFERRLGRDGDRFTGSAETLAHAICLAALASVSLTDKET